MRLLLHAVKAAHRKANVLSRKFLLILSYLRNFLFNERQIMKVDQYDKVSD